VVLILFDAVQRLADMTAQSRALQTILLVRGVNRPDLGVDIGSIDGASQVVHQPHFDSRTLRREEGSPELLSISNKPEELGAVFVNGERPQALHADRNDAVSIRAVPVPSPQRSLRVLVPR
jgi:hypothetical protein